MAPCLHWFLPAWRPTCFTSFSSCWLFCFQVALAACLVICQFNYLYLLTWLCVYILLGPFILTHNHHVKYGSYCKGENGHTWLHNVCIDTATASLLCVCMWTVYPKPKSLLCMNSCHLCYYFYASLPVFMYACMLFYLPSSLVTLHISLVLMQYMCFHMCLP